ncbi:Protein tolR [Pseudodesulfovibrio piezophilus C1TLV30]|uniref:Protein tolR n=2 Tax=Pseudodesulfovibrio TaxID=2035811 RepID=M1WNB3_PSEP2|nr:Protein tolR [Pseudodesulfovibrio piezophilus C1TLV30]
MGIQGREERVGGVMAIKTGGGFLNEINVTPFVDVMLVLLIIFMVTAPLMTQGVEVDLPTTRTVKNLPQDSEHLVLSIKKDGTLFLDEYQVGLEELESHLKRLVSKQKKQLFLRADKEVAYGTVVQVMGEIKAAGIDRLGIVAEQNKDDKKK